MKKILLISSLYALTFVACKKSSTSDNNNNPCTLSASSFVGNYKMTAQVSIVNGVSTDIFNDPSQIDPCFKDNIYTFNANGTYATTEGVDVCNPSNAETGTWALNGTSISINSSGRVDVGTISEFNCSSFKIIDTTDPSETLIITFARQ